MSSSCKSVLGGACLLCFSASGHAQLLDDSLVNDGGAVNAPLGTIAKSLQEQIGAGRGDELTPGSSVYLIARDPARSIRRGRQLFQRKFSASEGQGPRVGYTSTGDVTQMRSLGAGLADSCAACHGRPRGAAGFGGDVATFPDSRDAPHLFGLGIVEQLADEMTAELRAIRAAALDQAANGGAGGTEGTLSCTIVSHNVWPGNYQVNVKVVNKGAAPTEGWSVTLAFNQPANIYNFWNVAIAGGDSATVTASNVDYNERIYPGGSITFGVQGTQNGGFAAPTCTTPGGGGGGPVTLPLTAKGVSFGSITAFPDGSVDTGGVEGVNEDLRIRPFLHHGGTVSMREFVVGAFKAEMGLEVYDPVLCAVTDFASPEKQVTPAGFVYDPALDTFERPAVCDASEDGDGDGIVNEVDAALLDHMEFYLLNYFKPGRYRITARTEQGLALMDSIGCTDCHVQNLTIDSDRRVADVETAYDPSNGIFNDLFATATTLFHFEDDGHAYPRIVPDREPFVVRNFFSDLKRHDLGPAFHERDYDGSTITEFVTEPLWGVGTSAPYGHDGRSINLDQAIRRHGGEALEARQAYESLGDDGRDMIVEFLQSLVLFPPDDTASNLNPGNPATQNPQDPAEHGTINLGALFAIPTEGGE